MKKSSFNLGKVLNKKQQQKIHGGNDRPRVDASRLLLGKISGVDVRQPGGFLGTQNQ